MMANAITINGLLTYKAFKDTILFFGISSACLSEYYIFNASFQVEVTHSDESVLDQYSAVLYQVSINKN